MGDNGIQIWKRNKFGNGKGNGDSLEFGSGGNIVWH